MKTRLETITADSKAVSGKADRWRSRVKGTQKTGEKDWMTKETWRRNNRRHV